MILPDRPRLGGKAAMIRLGDGIMAAEGDPELSCTGDFSNQQQLTSLWLNRNGRSERQEEVRPGQVWLVARGNQ